MHKHQPGVDRDVGEKVDNTRQITQLTRMIDPSDSGNPKVAVASSMVEVRWQVTVKIQRCNRDFVTVTALHVPMSQLG